MIVLIVILLCIILFIAFQGNSKPTVPRRISYVSPTRKFSIAGITKHCGKKDIGVIIGKTVDDPENSYDKHAVAIIANAEQEDEKLLGYIRKDDQPTYGNFAYKSTELPFVGFIEQFENESGRMTLFGKIRVFNGTAEDMETDMTEALKYLAEAFQIKQYDQRIEILDKF